MVVFRITSGGQVLVLLWVKSINVNLFTSNLELWSLDHCSAPFSRSIMSLSVLWVSSNVHPIVMYAVSSTKARAVSFFFGLAMSIKSAL